MASRLTPRPKLDRVDKIVQMIQSQFLSFQKDIMDKTWETFTKPFILKVITQVMSSEQEMRITQLAQSNSVYQSRVRQLEEEIQVVKRRSQKLALNQREAESTEDAPRSICKIRSPSENNDPNPELCNLLPHFQSLNQIKATKRRKSQDHTFTQLAKSIPKDSERHQDFRTQLNKLKRQTQQEYKRIKKRGEAMTHSSTRHLLNPYSKKSKIQKDRTDYNI